MHSPTRASSRSRSGPKRSPVFPSLDRKLLWIERTRLESLTDFDKATIEGEILAMTDEAVTAALDSSRLTEEDVKDSTPPPPPPERPASAPPAMRAKPITVMDVDDNDESDHHVLDRDPTDRYRSIPAPIHPAKDIPFHPYVPERRVRYANPTDEFRATAPVSGFVREMTTESMRARRAPIPTIESQTKPPAKFKGEEMSFIKVDVFLKKMERYLRAGHGLDLSTDDIGDYIYDSLDDYAYRWFHTLRKLFPYLFEQFDKDLHRRYVPINYKDQLADEYEAVKQGDNRLFTDYLTELRDYEDMLGDVTPRDKYRVLKKGINDDLRKNMVVFEGIPYDEFVDHATHIDPALMKKRQEREAKEKKSNSATVSQGNKASTSRHAPPDSNRRRFRPTSSSKPARKPAVKELRPEITRAECDRRGLCRHCKEAGHLRRDCPELRRVQPSAHALDLHDAFEQVPLRPTVNKVRQGYAVKDTRSYRDAALGKPRLEAPSWSVDKAKIVKSGDHAPNISIETNDHEPDPELPRLEEPLIARIRINGVEARCLINTGASGDFVSSHFAFVSRLKARKLQAPIPI